jgi:hypothetical protein
MLLLAAVPCIAGSLVIGSPQSSTNLPWCAS